MTDNDLKEALRESNDSNESKTERMNELKSGLEAHEAREWLAQFTDSDPEDFEEMDDEATVEFAAEVQKHANRQNSYPIGQELQGAVNANVTSTTRSEWERRKNGDDP